MAFLLLHNYMDFIKNAFSIVKNLTLLEKRLICIKKLYVGARLLNFNSEVNQIMVIPEGYYLLSKKNKLPEFFNDQVVTLELGNITIDGIRRSNYIYKEHSHDQVQSQGYPIDNRISDAELGIKLVKQFDGEMNRFLNALWFVKDNSVCCDGSQYINSVSKVTLYSSGGEFFSNGSGGLSDVEFSEEELEEAEDWFDLITEHAVMRTIGDVNYRDIMTIGKDGKEKVNLSSFSRSLLYLNSARKSGFIPGKISLYTSILETLFAVKKDNTRKVSERLSIFIGDSDDETELIYKNMKKLYDIRSSYVHGSDLRNMLERQLIDYSLILDTYVRKAMKKTLSDYTELNYGKGTNKNFKKVDQWFEELVTSYSNR